jgi:predicted ATPase
MPKRTQPIYGANGTGKSTFFDVLSILSDFIGGIKSAEEAFPFSSLTRWETSRNQQIFEIDFTANSFDFKYRVAIEHFVIERKSRVAHELLKSVSDTLYESKNGLAQLYHDNGTFGPQVQLDWNRSGLSFLGARHDNQKLNSFREGMRHLNVFRLNPSSMSSIAATEQYTFHENGENFASWLRHSTQEDLTLASRVMDDLRIAIPGFDSFALVRDGGDVRSLKIDMKFEGRTKLCRFDFKELSEGQLILFVLYSILYGKSHRDAILCFDEPMNYVALAEIQPYLIKLTEMVEDSEIGQVFIATHNGETINFLTLDDAALFVKESSGPIRVKSFDSLTPGGLRASDIMARGWEEAK